MWIKCCLIGLVLSLPALGVAQTEVQLATQFSDDIHVQDYFVSEKYDGIRAIWTGSKLITRKGNNIHAPKWFTEKLPNIWLDGELWTQHNDFANILSIVRKKQPIDQEWRQIKYMIFDAPDQERSMTFEQRYARYKRILEHLELPHVLPVQQFTVVDLPELYDQLNEYVASGAEGLMLHRKLAVFESGRTDNLLKLKPYVEKEAKVVAVLAGQGKYEHKMGSVLVEMPSGVRFKIGSGFSDQERENPPAVGSTIIFKHSGFTQRGIPRFAVFQRLRYATY
ncbi:DNA ligase [Marinomonas posidonica]|uniref:DNA ligase (ATP) n=1 Tax=Marinomonas posidonica (strain CECT 7376 / NCIMB 14433 / IVIA-Po-181) TaxID=491952 RepID=F6CZC1_MARPP|nr:DNA ligase [Marinomonas posidonica]AEF54658.1 DNA ligase (ATP) [Marinomonas posidonica IVIA-Po-181]